MVPASLQSNRKQEKQADMHTNIYLLINMLGAEMVVNGMFSVHDFITRLKNNKGLVCTSSVEAHVGHDLVDTCDLVHLLAFA
jgi:hypothetical protein